MRGRKWYKKDSYYKPRDPFDPGDGSLVEVTKDSDERHPEALKVVRVWPDGCVTTVRLVPPGQFSQAIYLSVEGDIERPKNESPHPSLDERLGSGQYRAPHPITSSVPGNKPGDDYDTGTGKRFPSRSAFEQYYKENNLAKLTQSDAKNMPTTATEPTESNNAANVYDVRKGPPPVPSRFQGVKMYTKSSD